MMIAYTASSVRLESVLMLRIAFSKTMAVASLITPSPNISAYNTGVCSWPNTHIPLNIVGDSAIPADDLPGSMLGRKNILATTCFEEGGGGGMAQAPQTNTTQEVY